MNPSNTRPMIAALRARLGRVNDPEFGLSVTDLGLIYDVSVDASGGVTIVMTLTSMYCPAGDVILGGIKAAAEAVAGVTAVDVQLVWEPMWTPERLSAEGRAQLGWDDPQVEA